MAISIHKILSVRVDPNYNDGSRVASFVLDDGNSKVRSILGGLSDNNAQARASILARGQELYNYGERWDDSPTNIESPAKDFLDNLPDYSTAETSIDNISSLAGAKPVLKKMAKAILALKEMVM